MTDSLVPLSAPAYWLGLSVLLTTRGADFLSTWVATPHLVLEGNPIARRLGWKWGAVVNGLACLLLAAWPLATVIVATTSALVAARNFQSAWLMRALGEWEYRDWYVHHLRRAPLGLQIFCLAGQTLLFSAVGGILVGTTPPDSVAHAVGLGILTYALAVAIYTGLALWRLRRE